MDKTKVINPQWSRSGAVKLFFIMCAIVELVGNLSQIALSNTMLLNHRNSEIVHFCNDNDSRGCQTFDHDHYH